MIQASRLFGMAPRLGLGRLTPRHPSDSNREPASSPEGPPADSGLRIGCWSGDEFVIVDARLVNICRHGLMVIVHGAVRDGQTVWIQLEGTRPSEKVPATVLGATWLGRGRFALRLELPETCPAGFYETLIRCLASHARPDPRPGPMGRRQPATPLS